MRGDTARQQRRRLGELGVHQLWESNEMRFFGMDCRTQKKHAPMMAAGCDSFALCIGLPLLQLN